MSALDCACQVGRNLLRVILRLPFGYASSLKINENIVSFGQPCEHDACNAVLHNLGQEAEFLWHDAAHLV